MIYTERSKDEFLRNLLTEVRYSIRERVDISLFMVSVKGDMEPAFEQLTDIKLEEVPHMKWRKYDDKPVFAMYVPNFSKDEATGLVDKINTHTHMTAVSTTYEGNKAGFDTLTKDAELMVYDLLVKQLGL